MVLKPCWAPPGRGDSSDSAPASVGVLVLQRRSEPQESAHEATTPRTPPPGGALRRASGACSEGPPRRARPPRQARTRPAFPGRRRRRRSAMTSGADGGREAALSPDASRTLRGVLWAPAVCAARFGDPANRWDPEVEPAAAGDAGARGRA